MVSLKTVCAWVDIVTKVVSAGALVVAAGWAFYRFGLESEQDKIERNHVWNMQVTMDAVPLNVGEPDSALLMITAKAKNIGKIAVHPSFPGGFKIKVYEHQDLAKEITEGEPTLVEWNKNVNRKVPGFDMLSRYAGSSGEVQYVINPGQEVSEVEVVRVKPGELYGVIARFFVESDGRPGGSTSDSKYVFIPQPVQ
jgi:hypothetical protein